MVPGFYKRPWIIIAVCFAITAFFAAQLPKLRVENDIREWLSPENPSRERLNQSDSDFGSTRMIGIALETEKKSVLTPEYISTIATIAERIEALDGVEDVTSIGNVDYVCALDGSLSSSPLVPKELFDVEYDENGKVVKKVFAGTSDDIDEIRHKIIEWSDMYDRVILSDDGRASQMSIVVQSTDDEGKKISINQQLQVLSQVQSILDEELAESDLKQTIYGDPVTTFNSKAYMLSDLVSLIPIVVIVVLVCFFFWLKYPITTFFS